MNFQFNNFQKILFTLIIFCGILGLAGSSLAAEPATYYIDDNDCSDDYAGTSSDQPLCTFAEAMTKLQAGDTLLIKDGVYYQTLDVTVSGAAGSPITIKAENDGGAVVDGEFARKPLFIYNVQNIIVEGIIFKRSGPGVTGNHVVDVSADNIILRRISAYDAGSGNNSLFTIYDGDNILVEDFVASGIGRDLVKVKYATNVVLRRGYVRASQCNSGGDTGAGIGVYPASGVIIENCIVTVANSANCSFGGIGALANNVPGANNNSFLGNIVINATSPQNYTYTIDAGYSAASRWYSSCGDGCYLLTGNTFKNNVAIGTYRLGLEIDNDSSAVVQNNTLVGGSLGGSYTTNGLKLNNWCQTKGCSSVNTTATIKNNSIIGWATTNDTGLLYENLSAIHGTNTYNNLYGNATNYGGKANAGTGDKTLNPAYDTATYGNGSYLMVPTALQGKGESGADIGAEVLYQYKDGVLTNEPLWPWPMEDRIKNETSISVTYASNGGLWGGTWEATKDWNEIYGGSSDATPPAAPSGLSVQ